MNIKIDQERIEEWEKLKELVHVAGTLNRGNNIVAKIQRLEALADRVNCTDYKTPRVSFMGWMHDIICQLSEEQKQ